MSSARSSTSTRFAGWLFVSAIAGACSAGPTIAPPTPEPTWDISVPYVKPTHLPPEVVSAPNQPLPPLTPVPPPSTLGRPRHDLGPPASQPAEIGRTYAFATDHCGLDDSVDFDGSYWTVSAMSDDPKSVSVNSAIGTITLESHDVALFRSGAFAARLARLTGTVWGRTCM